MVVVLAFVLVLHPLISLFVTPLSGLHIPDVQASDEPAGKVIVFHAGSLSIPFEKMEREFEERYPAVDIQREASGSRRCATKITELKKPCDIMAASDFTVIDELLVPEHADWNIRFATNRLVICHTEKSEQSDKINSDNWFEILSERGVVWGRADPNADPCGYRTLMALQLAEKHYGISGLYKRLIDNCPENNIRPKEVDMVALLQTGNMDYAWIYRSVAVQHGLKFVELPSQINLGDHRFDDLYRQAVVEITGRKPGATMKKRGRSCAYGVTLLKDAPNRKAATAFLGYLLHPEGGLKVLDEMGQPPIIPCLVPTAETKASLPAELQQLVVVED